MNTKTFSAIHQAQQASRPFGLPALLRVMLPLTGALFLWGLSLQYFDLSGMTDLGLVSVAPPLLYVAYAVLILGFCWNLQDWRMKEVVFWLYTAVLISMLHGTPHLLYGTVRYSWAWKHVGIIDFIQRYGAVQPDIDYLAAYHNWPGFFTLNALITEISGLGTALAYAGWAPVVFNLLGIGPLRLIYTSLTRDRRLIWLAIWFFYLTNWIGQDYFGPQALSYFLYLVMIGVCLRWFQNAHPRLDFSRATEIRDVDQSLEEFYDRPDGGRPEQDALLMTRPFARMGIIAILVLIAVVLASTHQLTPWITLSALALLALFRIVLVSRLSILVGVLSTAWVIFMATAFLEGNLYWVVRSIGTFSANFTATLINLADASPGQALVAVIDRALSALIWGLAFLGGLRRFRHGYWDLPAVLLAIAPFALLAANSYGGEGLFRVYLFALPAVAFFAAALIYPGMASGRSWRTPLVTTLLSCLMLAGMVFSYYGKELMFYFTRDEVAGTQYVTQNILPGSLLVDGTGNWPRQYKYYELYDYFTIAEQDPEDRKRILADPVGQLTALMSEYPSAYYVVSRSQAAFVNMTGVMPAGSLGQITIDLMRSGQFRVAYNNADIIVLEYLHPTGGTPP